MDHKNVSEFNSSILSSAIKISGNPIAGNLTGKVLNLERNTTRWPNALLLKNHHN